MWFLLHLGKCLLFFQAIYGHLDEPFQQPEIDGGGESERVWMSGDM